MAESEILDRLSNARVNNILRSKMSDLLYIEQENIILRHCRAYSGGQLTETQAFGGWAELEAIRRVMVALEKQAEETTHLSEMAHG